MEEEVEEEVKVEEEVEMKEEVEEEVVEEEVEVEEEEEVEVEVKEEVVEVEEEVKVVEEEVKVEEEVEEEVKVEEEVEVEMKEEVVEVEMKEEVVEEVKVGEVKVEEEPGGWGGSDGAVVHVDVAPLVIVLGVAVGRQIWNRTHQNESKEFWFSCDVMMASLTTSYTGTLFWDDALSVFKILLFFQVSEAVGGVKEKRVTRNLFFTQFNMWN